MKQDDEYSDHSLVIFKNIEEYVIKKKKFLLERLKLIKTNRLQRFEDKKIRLYETKFEPIIIPKLKKINIEKET